MSSLARDTPIHLGRRCVPPGETRGNQRVKRWLRGTSCVCSRGVTTESNAGATEERDVLTTPPLIRSVAIDERAPPPAGDGTSREGFEWFVCVSRTTVPVCEDGGKHPLTTWWFDGGYGLKCKGIRALLALILEDLRCERMRNDYPATVTSIQLCILKCRAPMFSHRRNI